MNPCKINIIKDGLDQTYFFPAEIVADITIPNYKRDDMQLDIVNNVMTVFVILLYFFFLLIGLHFIPTNVYTM